MTIKARLTKQADIMVILLDLHSGDNHFETRPRRLFHWPTLSVFFLASTWKSLGK